MAPIDPLQLLKALSPLLSMTGGIKSSEEVARLSSLMKKFSRKLVSRCVYVNVLKTTDAETLDRFLVKGGWDTIHIWLQDSKKGDNHSFLIDLLKLFKHLPMTIERLKENSSAKMVKALCKSDSEEVKKLANDVVLSWMKLVKGAEPVSAVESGKNSKHQPAAKKRKKRDGAKEKKEPVKDAKTDVGKEKDGKKVGKDGKASKENKTEDFEDVKLPEYIGREVKEPKTDRKKTVKLYQAKFRSTGLEEETPLPKAIPKKGSTSKALPSAPFPRIPSKRTLSSTDLPQPSKNLMSPEKKFKPSNLSLTTGLPASLNLNQEPEKPGIKLIPAKPRPVHTLQDSTGFMDALVAPPTPVIRKKKKGGKVPTTPPSPTVAPKLQFYKDTMETQSENESEEKKKDGAREDNESGERANNDATGDTVVDMVADDSATGEVASPSNKNGSQGSPKSGDSASGVVKEPPVKRKKKSVSFADDANIRQIFYFESDDNERVNVNNLQRNFGDMKTLERMKERQAVQNARRIMGDKMDEKIPWVVPHLLDLPPPVVEMGCHSVEKGIQTAREEGTLQELYLTKDLLPDGPYEPEPETFNQEEPKLIPLEDENNPDAVIDFSAMEPLVPISSLPPVISSLLMSIPNKNPATQGMKDDMGSLNAAMVAGPSGLLGRAPPGFDPLGGHGPRFPGGPEDMGPPHPGANMMEGMEYMEGPGPGPPPHMMGGPGLNPRLRMQGPMRMHGPMRGRGGMMFPGPPRGMMRGRGDGRGGSFPGRGRYLCRHFMAGGCNYEGNCKFLHPGVNGPPLP